MMRVQCTRRIASQGLLNTAWYYFGTYFLPRIGIQYKHLYEFAGEPDKSALKRPEGVSVQVAVSMSDLNAHDIGVLEEFEGAELIVRCERAFRARFRCAIARKAACGLVGMIWIAPASPQLSCCGTPTYNLRDGFVLPNMRGHSIYPCLLAEACRYILTAEAHDRPRIVLSTMLANRAAHRSNTKAGFHRIGATVVFFGRQKSHFRPLVPDVPRACSVAPSSGSQMTGESAGRR